MYWSLHQAHLLIWHAENQSIYGMVRHVVNSRQWCHVNAIWPDFAIEPQNIRLELATDGINPFSVKCSAYSTWSVLLLNYNLLPWLLTRHLFIMLVLIISEWRFVTGDNFDIYMEPLFEELIFLWTHGPMLKMPLP